MFLFLVSRLWDNVRMPSLRAFKENNPIGQGLYSSLSYFTSRYFLLACLVMFVVHRIQHIVPRRRPQRLSIWQHGAIRLPAVLLLLRVILLCLSMSALSGGPFHSLNRHTIKFADSYSLDANSTARVMWSMLVAFAASNVCEHFARALCNEVPFVSSSNNIHSLSGLAYFYSAPPEAFGDFTPSGNIYLCLAFCAFELCILHLMVLLKQEQSFRFAITGAFTISLQVAIRYIQYHSLDISDAGLRILERFPESLLAIIALTTIFIHAAAQLVLEGRLTTQIFGHDWPEPSDDFLIGIMKYAASCLESTRIGGLNNELKGISAPAYTYIDISRDSSSSVMIAEPNLLLGNNNHLSNDYNNPNSNNNGVLSRPVAGIRVHSLSGDHSGATSSARSRHVNIKFLIAYYRFFRSLAIFVTKKFLEKVGLKRKPSTAVNNEEQLWEISKLPSSVDIMFDDSDDDDYVQSDDDNNPDVDEEVEDDDDAAADELEDHDTGYSDQEDDNIDQAELSGLIADMALPQQHQNQGHQYNPDETNEMMSIYLAHSTMPTIQSSPSSALVQSTGSPSSQGLRYRPMTRQTYFSSMTNNAHHGNTAKSSSESRSFDKILETFINERRSVSTPHLNPDEVDRNMCIVCRCEPRTVLTFPCCCLTMCDTCRENLASRQGTSQQKCIACRRGIDGYSRVWIP